MNALSLSIKKIKKFFVYLNCNIFRLDFLLQQLDLEWSVHYKACPEKALNTRFKLRDIFASTPLSNHPFAVSYFFHSTLFLVSSSSISCPLPSQSLHITLFDFLFDPLSFLLHIPSSHSDAGGESVP